MLGERADFGLEPGLLGIHRGHAAGQHNAQPAAQFVAHGSEALGLGGLALEAVHLPRDFFEDVVDAGEVLLRAFEAQLGETLLGFEAGDAGGFFDDGAAIVRLGAEQLADALLADDGVALRAEAGAHEDVLNVAQAAELAVEQIFAFAGAEQAACDDDFALLRSAMEFAAADLENHGLRAFGSLCMLGFFGLVVLDDLTRLFRSDDLLGFDCALATELVFVPVGRASGSTATSGSTGTGPS